MVSITPVTEQLNNSARNIIKSVVLNESKRRVYIKDFLKTANDNNAQSTAIVAFVTEYRNACKNKNKLSKVKQIMLNNFRGLFQQTINTTPELKALANDFDKRLKETYPKTYDLRCSIASQGAVSSDCIEPKSWFKKLMIKLEQFAKPEE